MFYRYHPSPLGPLLLAGDEQGLRLLYMDVHHQHAQEHWQLATNELDDVCQQLDEYFARKREVFDLSLAPQGTPFQQQVWQALLLIPYGRTWTYGEQARHLDNPKAIRAVGKANGANPISIIIPCHRVVGSDGTLIGFGGGIENKLKLLELEGSWLI
ncbi:methylated-DNA--[protein]-cysteine S-methyltransferase [Pseudomonas sp. CCM 7893]|uniref:Methylated-DNA--protein-cysteine methyltransferase n=1 Tax=Pseudomonas spelaei TaxID=1055469 RepID=A0A6I3WCY9_9PSED|nr:methylated-DNA--[protein]-cysteine S-methyltransferase [Pseudomonas spelaei]MUF07608.1 methylated-DNA--[protein]-cysteine S-methyltransferase [Pseudomonas spelaei]